MPKAGKHSSSGHQRPARTDVVNPGDLEIDFTKLRCAVRIIPVFDWSDCPFTPARLHPARDNLRSLSSSTDSSTPASPIYNSDVASDGSPTQALTYMNRIADRSDAFAQAALLLKTWALQRNLNKEYGLSHCLYLLSTLLAYVFDGTCKGVKTVPAGSGAWQAFKACLDTLGMLRALYLHCSEACFRDSLNAPQYSSYRLVHIQAGLFHLRPPCESA